MAKKFTLKELEDHIISQSSTIPSGKVPAKFVNSAGTVEDTADPRYYILLYVSMMSDYRLKRGLNDEDKITDEKFINLAAICWNTIRPDGEPSFASLNASWFKESMKWNATDAPLGYLINPEAPQEFEKIPEILKAQFLMILMFNEIYGIEFFRDPGKMLTHDRMKEWYGLTVDNSIAGRGGGDGCGSGQYNPSVKSGLLAFYEAIMVDEYYPGGQQDPWQSCGSLLAPEFWKSFTFRSKTVDPYAKLDSPAALIVLAGLGLTTPEEIEAAKKDPSIIAKKLAEEKAKTAAETATLDFSELTGRLGEDASEELKAFLKRAEQCFLLGSSKVFAVLGEKNRKDDFVRPGGIVFPVAGETTVRPYGGRVYPVKCDTESGTNAQYINLMNTDSGIYDFTKNYTLEVSKTFRYNYMFYKIESDPRHGEIEKPLLFGPNKDPNSSNRNNPQGEGVKIAGMEGKPIKVDRKLEKLVLGGKTLSKSRGGIVIKSVNIKFQGETAATARSNVDVSVEIDLSDISLLQAEYKAKTVLQKNGTDVEVEYKYSLLDFITYTFNVNTSDINKLMGKGQTRLFTPKFTRNHNRMMLKVSHTLLVDKKKSTSEKKVNKIDNLDINDTIKKKIKNHLESSDLILDLTLVDHTIKKDPVTQKASISIEYKGFTKTFMNDPISDISRTIKEHEEIKSAEQGLIKKLAKMKQPQKARREITIYNKRIEDLNKTHIQNGVNEIIKNLRKRRKIFRTKYDASQIFKDNITKDGYEIYNPAIINDYFQKQYNSAMMSVLTELGPRRINAFGAPAYGDIDVGKKEEDKSGAEVLTEENQSAVLDFFYFGDLCDAILDNFYQYNPPYAPAIEGELGHDGAVLHTINRTREQLLPSHEKIPIKISLPTWRPLVAIGGRSLEEKVSSDTESETEKKEELDSNFEVFSRDLSLADFPIAMNTFVKWWDKNVKEAGLSFLSVGSFLARFINDVINKSLLETCYQNGYGNITQYAVKLDYGLWGSAKGTNNAYKASSRTWWEDAPQDDGFYKLSKDDSPFLKKPTDVYRSEMCNFVIVYSQTIPFSEAKELENTPISHRKNNIPKFELYSKAEDNYKPKSALVPKGIINRSVQFNKVENSKYLREYRYDVEGLSTLSQISSVYNATVISFPMLAMYPGMLFYAAAGLYQDSETFGSIAHILGLGGYHVTTAVTHNFKLNPQGQVENPRTTIEGVWTFTGANKGSPPVEGDGGSDVKEEEPPAPDATDEERAEKGGEGTGKAAIEKVKKEVPMKETETPKAPEEKSPPPAGERKKSGKKGIRITD